MTVGPVLEAGAVGRAIAAAIRAENAGAEVIDRGAYLRVRGVAPLRVTRAAIERALGRAVALPGDLELVMPSFAGRLAIGADEVSWT